MLKHYSILSFTQGSIWYLRSLESQNLLATSFNIKVQWLHRKVMLKSIFAQCKKQVLHRWWAGTTVVLAFSHRYGKTASQDWDQSERRCRNPNLSTWESVHTHMYGILASLVLNASFNNHRHKRGHYESEIKK